MLKEIFSFKDWERLSDLTFIYHKIEILKDIDSGVFYHSIPEGTKFDWAQVDYENGTLVFFNRSISVAIFDLTLSLKRV